MTNLAKVRLSEYKEHTQKIIEAIKVVDSLKRQERENEKYFLSKIGSDKVPCYSDIPLGTYEVICLSGYGDIKISSIDGKSRMWVLFSESFVDSNTMIPENSKDNISSECTVNIRYGDKIYVLGDMEIFFSKC